MIDSLTPRFSNKIEQKIYFHSVENVSIKIVILSDRFVNAIYCNFCDT